MATSARQIEYNKKYREKQQKIKHFSKELDAVIGAVEKLPVCPECQAKSLRLGLNGQGKVECEHTPERKRLMGQAALARASLSQVEGFVLDEHWRS